MEWLHIGQGLEWWQSIIVTTVIVRSAKLMSFFNITSFITRFNLKMWIYFRLIVTPVVVYAQRNMAHMTNNAPEMARLQVCNIKWCFVWKKVNQPHASIQPSLSGNKSDEFQEKFTAARQRMDMYEIDKTQKQLQVCKPSWINFGYLLSSGTHGQAGSQPPEVCHSPFSTNALLYLYVHWFKRYPSILFLYFASLSVQ